MAPVYEVMWRAVRGSLAVMCPAGWGSPGDFWPGGVPRIEAPSFERDRRPNETPGEFCYDA
jgi:hypothetical protein